jgi:hypothetical protein
MNLQLRLLEQGAPPRGEELNEGAGNFPGKAWRGQGGKEFDLSVRRFLIPGRPPRPSGSTGVRESCQDPRYAWTSGLASHEKQSRLHLESPP